ncbi:hypothetical protein CRENPOLYSF2_590005 [Crenothrix polyspora]|uniref:Uncharacterized protein n=1 Tax=Crenothrix polyspora TaxID=360316 RepID=A0A1R4HH15_9GAMM|nr:hypothetical protein CRENPOLYSF2_590005 [Crenothrix polyspora]
MIRFKVQSYKNTFILRCFDEFKTDNEASIYPESKCMEFTVSSLGISKCLFSMLALSNWV